MSFDWSKYVIVAEKFINHDKGEDLESAYYRSSVSRSYYGAFCLARDLLISKGANIPDRDTHKYVREQFQQGDMTVIKKVGSDLLRLWNERKNADYDASEPFDKTRAEKALKIAKQLLKLYTDEKVRKIKPS